MADSDEESDRRRSRDKFRRERSDHDGRRRPGDKREPFDDRSGTVGAAPTREDHRLSGEGRNDRGRSPAEPPYKRPRKDNSDDYKPSSYQRKDTKSSSASEYDGMYRPPVIPFKRFLDPLDDLITEEEACSKYKEYKEGYMKRHTEEFFEAHKNEEWLRLRYHPDHMNERKAALSAAAKHRLDVFMELLHKGFLENQSVQMDNSENLIKLMDAVVIKLEGGSDEDLKVLEESDRNRYSDEELVHQSQSSGPICCENKSEGEAESDDDFEHEKLDTELTRKVMPEPLQTQGSTVECRTTNRRTRTESNKSGSSAPSQSSQSSDSDSGSSSDDEADESTKSKTEVEQKSNELGNTHDVARSEVDEDDDDVPTPTTAESPRGCKNEDSSVSMIIGSINDTSVKHPIFGDPSDAPQPKFANPPRLLHKTASIFFRALPPTIKESELKELCASQPGFIRLALWEPVPERRFMRHAWATYDPSVNIKKICWALNTSSLLREKLELPNGELGATVNRDLAQRVRPLTPLTRHKPVMRQDLILAAQLVARLDAKHNLWSDLEIPDTLEMAIKSKNPLLKNLTDYLVDEAETQAEAEGCDNNNNNVVGRVHTVTLESDPNLARTLDLLILYLRIVHSMDYYAGAIYPMEDLMPHRCGILHARGDRGINPVPGARSSGLAFTQREINDHLQNFALKLRTLIEVPKDLTEEEMKKLGMRDPEKAAEEFVEANIQKRTGKKKPFKVVWVCPLSDKKFREPIFVRKHIFNKHMDKGRGSGRGNTGGSYRGYRNNSLLSTAPSYVRGAGSFQDYYDVAAQQQQHQAMAAVAAAAAAALYPNAATAADLYALAAQAGAPRTGLGISRSRGQRGSSPSHDFNHRPYSSSTLDNRRRQPTNYSTNRRPVGGGGTTTGERTMISYNDLDDPGNDVL
ncbi:putative arsenite-resistance protein 2 [Schistosoma mansoni]|uniref:putative arsenite-resistance protein 2 n=1 Tax=Schistosoma mansoni TaxID=6183 RepID=UPI00022DC2EB|nr:putative arsenite-resistance protein 2 [Schistosoma mansoni]|eukprot:XP_018652883.1 putative arsenite-resistance protein 2 [Schistosoma mansoni]